MEAAQLLELGMYMSWKGLREFLPLSLKANVTAETGQATTLNPKPLNPVVDEKPQTRRALC